MAIMRFVLLLGLLLLSSLGFGQFPVFATIAGGDLYAFDFQNCSRRFIGSTGYGFGDIALTSDGWLWGIVSGEIYRIDTATAVATLVGQSGVQGVSLAPLNDSILLCEYQQVLYGIRTADASAFVIDTVGYQADGDLTWLNDDLYIVSSMGGIVRIQFNSNQTAIDSVIYLIDQPLVCEGAVTLIYPTGQRFLFGFCGADLVRICWQDASSKVLCPNLNPGGTPGAAALRLSTQPLNFIACNGATVYREEPKITGLHPNPANDLLHVSLSSMEPQPYMISNLLGQVLRSGTLLTGENRIDLRYLPEGSYLLQCIGRAQLFTVQR